MFPSAHLPKFTWTQNVLGALWALCHPAFCIPGKWLTPTFPPTPPPLIFWIPCRTAKCQVRLPATARVVASRGQHQAAPLGSPRPGASSKKPLLQGGLECLIASSWDNHPSQGRKGWLSGTPRQLWDWGCSWLGDTAEVLACQAQLPRWPNWLCPRWDCAAAVPRPSWPCTVLVGSQVCLYIQWSSHKAL